MNTDVYSWRLPRSLKHRLEQAAREQGRSLADLLREIAEEWLATAPVDEAEAAMVEEARKRAMEVVGSIDGGDPYRAERAREYVRAHLRRKRDA